MSCPRCAYYIKYDASEVISNLQGCKLQGPAGKSAEAHPYDGIRPPSLSHRHAPQHYPPNRRIKIDTFFNPHMRRLLYSNTHSVNR